MDSIWPVVIASILFISLILVRTLRNAILTVEKSSVSELIEMDWNYLNRVSWRQKIIQDHPETVVGAEDICEPAINEFYTWLLGTYLPTRFPRMFRLSTAQKGVTTVLRSLVTGEEFCLDPPEKPVDALKIVGRLVDDDFQFLVRSEDGDGYVLKGIVTCCPSGFDMSKKINLKLRDIHKPIPGYKEKLEKSMDRFFDRLDVGTFVKRVNWTITTSNELFTPSGTHLYEGEEMPEVEIDINQVSF
ncbi:uncharacterized protein LTHEOB_2279 [Neofusicoccum parvum]|uniref:Uncharacterized protein LTHEOB_2279 n=1 Tax=Neofusicoccum parvum TaxID=310453 RepID=A0ACB5RN42_9PEZI|nr:uncharacterized protein LTHEOB_2279 [Neofusicoccum parvum]